MPAFWIVRSKIINPSAFKQYADRAPAIIERFGGKFLARGGRSQIFEGTERLDRFVIVEFPTFEQGVDCFNSAEYQEAAAFRRNGASEFEIAMVQGSDTTA